MNIFSTRGKECAKPLFECPTLRFVYHQNFRTCPKCRQYSRGQYSRGQYLKHLRIALFFDLKGNSFVLHTKFRDPQFFWYPQIFFRCFLEFSQILLYIAQSTVVIFYRRAALACYLWIGSPYFLLERYWTKILIWAKYWVTPWIFETWVFYITQNFHTCPKMSTIFLCTIFDGTIFETWVFYWNLSFFLD